MDYQADFEEMIRRINAGDASACDHYSRWMIENAWAAKRLTPPETIMPKVQEILDSCKESR